MLESFSEASPTNLKMLSSMMTSLVPAMMRADENWRYPDLKLLPMFSKVIPLMVDPSAASPPRMISKACQLSWSPACWYVGDWDTETILALWRFSATRWICLLMLNWRSP